MCSAECRHAMDVVFLLDCSDAERSSEAWNSTLLFVDDAVSRIHPRSGGTHVALVLLNGQTTTVIRKLDHQPMYAAQNLSMTCQWQTRDVSRCLRTLKQFVFGNREGDRPEVPDVLVLIVREAGVDDVEAAASLKADGIRIITVAIATSDETRSHLLKLASNDDDARRLVVARAEHYHVLLPTFIGVLCRTTDAGQLSMLFYCRTRRGLLPISTIQCELKKSPLRFSAFFPNGWEFLIDFYALIARSFLH